MKESASFWMDIKNLEERLAKSPDSFCFAQLADVYLKVGLVDDALHVARQGVEKHPGYLSGQRALSLSCHAKGLNDEALAALKLVVKSMPEDISSQKLLGRLLVEAGDQEAASQAFRTVLEFAPDDVESRIELESIVRSAGVIQSASGSYEDDDEEIIEDLEIVEDFDDTEKVSPEPGDYFADSVALDAPLHDPLSTGTLAELYVTQGFIHKALEIYRVILADNPDDIVTAERIADLETLESGSSGLLATEKTDDIFEEGVTAEQTFGMLGETIIQEMAYIDLSGNSCIPSPEKQHTDEECPSSLPLQTGADNTISALDGWLENIRRIKSCR